MQKLSLPYGTEMDGVISQFPESASVPLTPPTVFIDDLESALSQLMAAVIWGGKLLL
jgi:hypothetical protein